jgi:hypothetical protein
MIANEYELLPLRMPWELVCKVACIALLRNLSFDEIVEAAVRQGIEQESTQ